ncbi:hypothetical protein JOC75_004029 [Metabacillus crassostreae]|uniref:hypothetical protein n=1 Tax=Metabacillus crassostreae TaxID=929098 RepID=UPI00195A03C5|nr:hypothetical protein [Metabacillus crassostreae]MBM7606001.1 hypothetical protein [Metabacillus crassostreae]
MNIKESYAFIDEINNDTDLYKIIRGHLFIESKMINLIEFMLPFPEAININRMNFSTKIDLCISLGVIRKDEKECYKKFNIVRNDIAHNLDKEITEHEVDKIIDKLPFNIMNIHKGMEAFHSPKLSTLIASLYINLLVRVNMSNGISPNRLVEAIQSLKDNHWPK